MELMLATTYSGSITRIALGAIGVLGYGAVGVVSQWGSTIKLP